MTAKVYDIDRGPVIVGLDGVARRIVIDQYGDVQNLPTVVLPGDDVWKLPVGPQFLPAADPSTPVTVTTWPPTLDGKLPTTATPLHVANEITWNSAGYTAHDYAANGKQGRWFHIHADIDCIFACNFFTADHPEGAVNSGKVWVDVYNVMPVYDEFGNLTTPPAGAGGLIPPTFMQAGDDWWLYVSPGSGGAPVPDFDITMRYRVGGSGAVVTGAQSTDAVVIAGTSQSAPWSSADMPGSFQNGHVYIPTGPSTGQENGPDNSWSRWFKFTPTVDGRVSLDVQVAADPLALAYIFKGNPGPPTDFYLSPGYVGAILMGWFYLTDGFLTGTGSAAGGDTTGGVFSFDALAADTYYVGVGVDIPWMGAVSVSDRNYLLDVDNLVLRWDIP